MKEEKKQLIYLEFDDPTSLDEWTTPDEAKRRLDGGNNEAVGWIFHETKKHYYISAHTNNDCETSISASLRVPKAIVIKKKIISLD